MTAGYGLALHTGTPELGLAQTTPEGGIASEVVDLGRATSTELHVRLQRFWGDRPWSELAYVAVAAGPGGFTGTRLGVVTARTLAQQLNLPLFAWSSLAGVAWREFRTPGPATHLALELPAQRGELVTALYHWDDGQQQTVCDWPETLLTPSEWEARLARCPYPHRRVDAGPGQAATVTGLLAMARQRYEQGDRPGWGLAVPFYGQHPVER